MTRPREERKATESRNRRMEFVPRLTEHRVIRLLLRMLPVPFVPMPELFDLVWDLRRSRADLDRQVAEAIDALQRSSQLVSQLEEGLRERSDRLDRLREEYQRYSKLAEIEEDKVEALIAQLELSLGRERGRERWFEIAISLISGLLFFVAGALVSDPLQGWVHALSAWITRGG